MFLDYWTFSKDNSFYYFISCFISDYFVDSLIWIRLLIWASASSVTSFSPLEEFLIRMTFHSIFSLITASLIIYSLHIKTLVNKVHGTIEHAIHTSCPSHWCTYNIVRSTSSLLPKSQIYPFQKNIFPISIFKEKAFTVCVIFFCFCFVLFYLCFVVVVLWFFCCCCYSLRSPNVHFN